LRAHGDDEWVALARVAGVPVEVLSPGRFGLPGEDGAALDARVAGALGRATWRDPFTGEQTGFCKRLPCWVSGARRSMQIGRLPWLVAWPGGSGPKSRGFSGIRGGLWPLRGGLRALAIARKAGEASRSGPRGCRRN
jgi:capsular polysaccharide export protein